MDPGPAFRLRPTAAQAAGRGVHAGALVGAAGTLVAGVAGWLVTGGLGLVGWVAVLAPLMIGGSIGAGLGLAFGRGEGVDIDALGIRAVPAADHAYASWPHIADLRTERHGGRIHVAVYLRDGRSVRLRAPYNGRMLAADPEFEHKLVLLRHLWITHRHTRNRDER
jgi:hypothetical protein